MLLIISLQNNNSIKHFPIIFFVFHWYLCIGVELFVEGTATILKLCSVKYRKPIMVNCHLIIYKECILSTSKNQHKE